MSYMKNTTCCVQCAAHDTQHTARYRVARLTGAATDIGAAGRSGPGHAWGEEQQEQQLDDVWAQSLAVFIACVCVCVSVRVPIPEHACLL